MVLHILSSPYPIAPFSSYCSPKNPSIKEYVELHAALSTNTSTHGRGKLSLGLARFKNQLSAALQRPFPNKEN